jgi:hypothetical protein
MAYRSQFGATRCGREEIGLAPRLITPSCGAKSRDPGAQLHGSIAGFLEFAALRSEGPFVRPG